MNNTKIKTYTFALIGLILFSGGLCLFGESVIYKYENKDWFFFWDLIINFYQFRIRTYD